MFLSLALLGVGHVHARDHLSAISADASLSCMAVWEPDPVRRRLVPAELVVTDPLSAVERADVLVIDSVTSDHADLVPMVASAGKPLFVEKPLGRSGAEASSLASVIDRAAVPFATGFFLRCLPALRQARSLLQPGYLGHLVSVDATFAHAGLGEGTFTGPSSWMLDRDEAGFGGFGDLGTHLLDVLRWLRPGHRVEVERAWLDKPVDLNVDTGGHAALAWDDGVSAHVRANWVGQPVGLRMVLQGSIAVATVADGTLTVTGGRERRFEGEAPRSERALQAFIADLRGQPTWEAPTTSDAVAVAQLLDSVHRTALA